MHKDDTPGNETAGLQDETFERLVGLIYDELKPVARSLRYSMRPGDMFHTTEIVHDAIVRVAEREGADWESETHLKAFLARVMRNLLVDHLRQKTALKRTRPEFTDLPLLLGDTSGFSGADLMDLDKALHDLGGWAPRQARVVECRFFGGMTVEETSTALSLSHRSVERDWTKARAWLLQSLDRPASHDSGPRRSE